MTGRSIALFVAAAIAEIGGAYLVWQAMREGRPWWYALLGGLAPSPTASRPASTRTAHFGRILAAYGGIFVAGSLLGAWPSTVPPRPLGHRGSLSACWAWR